MAKKTLHRWREEWIPPNSGKVWTQIFRQSVEKLRLKRKKVASTTGQWSKSEPGHPPLTTSRDTSWSFRNDPLQSHHLNMRRTVQIHVRTWSELQEERVKDSLAATKVFTSRIICQGARGSSLLRLTGGEIYFPFSSKNWRILFRTILFGNKISCRANSFFDLTLVVVTTWLV